MDRVRLAWMIVPVALGISPPAIPDPLSEPGATDFSAISLPDLSGAEPLARSAMEEARGLANAALAADSRQAELAVPLGELCMLYHIHGIYRPATACYGNLRRLDPQRFQWHYLSAYLAQETGQPGRALELYAGAEAIDPGYGGLALRKGQAYLDTNRLEEAAAAFRQVAALPGYRASALYGLGQVAMLEKRYPEAIDSFNEALSLDPAASRIHYPLARALRAMGRGTEARDHLAQQGKGNPSARDPLVIELANLEAGARPHFANAMEAVRGNDYREAARLFRKGLELEPDNIHARVSYARVLYLIERGDEARKELETAAREDHELAHFLLGTLAAHEGRMETALAAYRRVLNNNPRHGGAHFLIARLALEQQRFRDALEHAEAAIAAEPGNSHAHIVQLLAAARLEPGQAVLRDKLDTARERFPGDAVFDYAQVRFLSLVERETAQALQLAGELVAHNPIPPQLSALALAEAANGDFERAADLQRQVVAMSLWTPFSEGMQRLLELYGEKRLPEAVWPVDDPMFYLPPLDPTGPFRDYPSARPY